jgi:hypothetical protein
MDEIDMVLKEKEEDLAYFKALENARKLSEQVDYFRAKKCANRDIMVIMATRVMDAHMQLLEHMRLEYVIRKTKGCLFI